MTPHETAQLWRMVCALCPQQATDEEYGVDAWHMALSGLRFADCREAAGVLITQGPWIGPHEILAEVRRIRSKRIADRAHELVPPAGLTDAEEREWLGQARRVIGDGDPLPPDARELRPRNLPDLRELLSSPDDRPRADPRMEPRRVQEGGAA